MAQQLPKIIVRDRAYIPINEIDVKAAKKRYTVKLYKEANCARCEYKPERHSTMCDACDAYEGELNLWKMRDIKDQRYIGLPLGDKKNFHRLGIDFEDFKIVDLRSTAPFDYRVKFTLNLRDYQEKMAKDFAKFNYGLIESPPRSGKTATTLGIAIRSGQKILITACQHEFLQNFIDHIEGSEKDDVPKCTNLPELQQKYGKKLYGFPKKPEDLDNFQIFLVTYQTFMSKKGRKLLREICKRCGVVLVDEAHKAGATQFASVLNEVFTRMRFGCTGTVKRKDGRHKITEKILGPIVARSKVEMMTPKVIVHDTGVKPRSQYKLWTYAMQFLAKHQKRNEMIVNQVIKDVQKGHGVVIPITFRKHAVELLVAINKKAEMLGMTKHGKPIAEMFLGGGGEKQKAARKAILDRAKTGETKVVIGMRQLIQMGLNVPRWSVIYEIIPISNEPNLKQETARVRTPREGKPQPLVRLFVDFALPQSLGCARNTINHMMGFKYDFSKTEKQKLLVSKVLTTSNRQAQMEGDDSLFKPSRADYASSGGGLLRYRGQNK